MHFHNGFRDELTKIAENSYPQEFAEGALMLGPVGAALGGALLKGKRLKGAMQMGLVAALLGGGTAIAEKAKELL